MTQGTTMLRIATRGSALALWQANWVRAELEARGVSCELVPVSTQGDRELMPFQQLRGQGFFTKAVQDVLIEGRADIAVHSLKDLPSAETPGLTVAAIPEREDSRDVLLALPDALDSGRVLGLRAGTVVGTSAVRRQAQLEAIDGSLKLRELRGNVPTRIEKLRRGEYGAIMLAAAGLNRLQLELNDLHVQALEPAQFVPAPGQGALALECRSEDVETIALLSALESPESRLTVGLERGLMARLEGGCQLALGASATHHGASLELLFWYGGRSYQCSGASVTEVINRAVLEIAARHEEAVIS
jgi:hydroxymethylbilane synthase